MTEMISSDSHRSSTVSPAVPAIDDAAYVGNIPDHYHRSIGPFLFEPYAQHTAERIRALNPKSVLETACGTGIVTKRLREALPENARLLSTDLNEPMMNIARRNVGTSAKVEWRQADMCDLSFANGDFDAVVCQFGLMFAPDKVRAVREMHRALRPGGRLLLTTWAPLERNPVILIAHNAIAALFPDDPPQFLPRSPFGYGDPDYVEEVLTKGGFSDVRVDAVEKASVGPNAGELAVGLIEGYPLRDEIIARGPQLLPAAIEAVRAAVSKHFGNGPVKTRITALVAIGTA